MREYTNGTLRTLRDLIAVSKQTELSVENAGNTLAHLALEGDELLVKYTLDTCDHWRELNAQLTAILTGPAAQALEESSKLLVAEREVRKNANKPVNQGNVTPFKRPEV